jgi:hypothetical protein
MHEVDCMSGFLDFILDIVFAFGFASDASKPIERTWRGFVAIMSFSLLCMAAMYGIIAILVYQYYLQGTIVILASVILIFLWYRIYKRFFKNK